MQEAEEEKTKEAAAEKSPATKKPAKTQPKKERSVADDYTLTAVVTPTKSVTVKKAATKATEAKPSPKKVELKPVE